MAESSSASSAPPAPPAVAEAGAAVYNPDLEIIMEGWGAKQGWKYPTWKVRWFVLQKKAGVPADSDDVTDARTYFKNSSDSYERAHNYNMKNDKANLIMTYFTDDSKTDMKEQYVFDENTNWCVAKSRVTCPKKGPDLESIHLFCKGSRGSTKLIFLPFWGWMQYTSDLICRPWTICMEFAKAKAYVGEHDDYYGDFVKVEDDVFGKTQKDMDKRREEWSELFADELIFKDHKALPFMAAALFFPIKFMGRNAQQDNKGMCVCVCVFCMFEMRLEATHVCDFFVC